MKCTSHSDNHNIMGIPIKKDDCRFHVYFFHFCVGCEAVLAVDLIMASKIVQCCLTVTCFPNMKIWEKNLVFGETASA